MKTRTHFTQRLDMGDDAAQNIIEHPAGVEDFEVAEEAYRAADLRPELVYKYRSATYEITVKRDAGSTAGMELDGRPVESSTIRLSDDGVKHRVTLRLAPSGGLVNAPTPAATLAGAVS